MFRKLFEGASPTPTTSAPTPTTSSNFSNPELFLTLPAAIAKHILSPMPDPKFDCPHREQLHQDCASATAFDKATIVPVNIALHDRGVPLHPVAYQAIKKDMDLSRRPVSTMSDQISKWHDQSKSQHNISQAFKSTGEHEGEKIHYSLAVLFKGMAIAAQVVQHGADLDYHGPVSPH